MAHLNVQFPDRLELGAERSEDWGTQINVRDDGKEVRNNRWASSLRSYDISLPAMERDDTDYLALRALFGEARGSLHSFNFLDWSDNDAIVAVRFDTPIRITGDATHLDHIDTFTLVEVRVYDPEGDDLIGPPPEFVSSSAFVSQNSGTLDLAYPSDIEDQDVAIAQLTVFDTVTTGVGWNTPAGWNLLASSFVNGDTKSAHYLFWKLLDGSETGTQTFTASSGGGDSVDSCSGKMTAFRGVLAGSDPYDDTVETSDAGNDTTPNAPVLSTLGPNRLILNFWAMKFPGSTFQPGTNYTELYDHSSTVGVDTGLKLTSRAVDEAQTYAGETASIGSNASQNQNCISLALRPALVSFTSTTGAGTGSATGSAVATGAKIAGAAGIATASGAATGTGTDSGLILLSGDEQSGTDVILLSGDMQDGSTDSEIWEET